MSELTGEDIISQWDDIHDTRGEAVNEQMHDHLQLQPAYVHLLVT